MTDLKLISLFTGAGGLDYGFEAAGYRTAAAVELDRRCWETLMANRSWPVIQADIASVSSDAILSAGGLRPGEADVLIGGPPCQPFSKAGFWARGEAGRLGDPRAGTLDAYMRVLSDTQPRAFLLENVEGLGFKGKDEGLQLVRRRLAEINRERGTSYRPVVATLNAADYGAPQLRRRLFIVGARDGAELQFPRPTHAASPPPGSGVEPYTTAWDALHDLPTPLDTGLRPRGKWAELLPTIPPGMNYLWHTDRGGGEPLFGWRRRYWTFLLKLAPGQPASTLQAQPGPATGPFHWDSRRLTMRELARLQTFPDSVSVTGSLADAQRQLGNAVPSLLAEVLAREIASQLLGRPSYSEPPRLSVRRAPTQGPERVPLPAVPERYLALRGPHPAHPGTGQGAGALARRLVAAE